MQTVLCLSPTISRMRVCRLRKGRKMKTYYRIAKIYKEQCECSGWTSDLEKVFTEYLFPVLCNKPERLLQPNEKIQLQKISVAEGVNPEHEKQLPITLQEFTLVRKTIEKWKKTQ